MVLLFVSFVVVVVGFVVVADVVDVVGFCMVLLLSFVLFS